MLSKVMNWVSRHILLAPFMCLFMLFGCGSSHKSIKTDAEVVRTDSTHESVNIMHGSTTSLSELITTEGNYVIDFRIYDTRKQPDSLTGKPPVLADGQIKGDFERKEEKKVITNDITEVEAGRETTSNQHEKVKTEEVNDKKESTLFEQISRTCVCITVLLVVMLVVRKHWSNKDSS